MAVNLTKGQKVNLGSLSKSLERVEIGLGWDTDSKKGFFSPKADWDLDAGVSCYTGKKQDVLVYFGKKSAYGGAVYHSGDNRTGYGDGDDETITINLKSIPEKIDRLRIVIHIYDWLFRFQHFGFVKNCYVRVTDKDRKAELIKYDMDDNRRMFFKTGLIVAELQREENGEWTFKAIGKPVVAFTIHKLTRVRVR